MFSGLKSLKVLLLCLWGALAPQALAGLQADKAEAEHAEVQQRFGEADLVSLVKVRFIGELVNPAMSVHGLIAVEGYVYTAEMLRQWKGVERNNIKLRVSLSDCHSRLQLDGQYVVFGKRGRDGDFYSFACRDMVLLEEAETLLGALDRLRDMQVAKHPKHLPSPI